MNLFDLVSGKDELTITLDLDDINVAIRKLESFQGHFKEACYLGLATASEKIRSKIIFFMGTYGLNTLDDAIFIEHDWNSITVQISKIGANGVDYVEYIEFGTGITGSWSPHPYRPWQYDQNGHGYKGWWYPTTDDDPNPTKRYFKDGILRAHTMGMPSRPFLYDTLNWVRAYNPIKREINKELRRIKI